MCTLRCVWLRRMLVAECGCVRHCGSAASVVGAGKGAAMMSSACAQLRSVWVECFGGRISRVLLSGRSCTAAFAVELFGVW